MQKREKWRKGLVLTKHQIMELSKARKVAKAAKDFKFDRRLRSIELVGKDLYTQESAAQILELTENAITRWVMAYRKGGIDALRVKKAKGAAPKLSKDDFDKLREYVRSGPEECGFDCGAWTCPLVQILIKREFDVKYSLSHIRRILHKLGFSVQYPKRILSEVDLEAQTTWLEKTYLAIKKSQK